MLFNTASFALFLPLVFLLYWFVAHRRLWHQNLLLLIASYFFYSCWDWRFLFLLVFSTFLDYSTGIKIFEATSGRSKKFWFWLSIIVNLGFLGVFKYYNFFAESFAESLGLLGVHVDVWTLNIILPVGISFYTFHGLSYVIDIYKGRIPPERNFVDYSLFVSFFPLLVAGPIERATHLLPQIKRSRTFSYQKAVDGLRQILWGLIKKVVIADQCSVIVNQVFAAPGHQSGSTLLVGAVLFAFQIYCDFSGYSDIALGVARLFGIELLRNFAFPYFSRDIAEFWRRWHISLSTWFRDYLYIPLGGSKGGTAMKVRNTFVIFLVSGFWHGANWTFIAWGGLNALFIMPSILFNTNRANLDIVARDAALPTLRELWAMLVTFALATFAWIFFRSQSVAQAVQIIKGIFSRSLFSKPAFVPVTLVVLICVFMVIEWAGRREQYAIATIPVPRPVRWVFYYSLVFAVFYFSGPEQQFIYFQF